MTTKHSLFVAISAMLIHGGCSLESGIDGDIIEPDATLLQPAAISTGSQSVNGDKYGFGRPGTEIFGQDARGMDRDGQMLTQLTLVGGALASTVVDTGRVLIDNELVGATFRTVTRSQEPIEIRIEDSESQPIGAVPDRTVHRYTILFNHPQEPGWQYACGVSPARDGIKAIPIDALWDYNVAVPGGGSRLDAPGWITFACDGFALAKCVDLGYLPWNLSDETSLAMYHQACTRMIRADYCGDGSSDSPDGIPIEVYDARGINPPPSTPSLSRMRIEAEWTDRGARCLRRHRQGPAYFAECPVAFELSPKVCGTPPHWEMTLLVSHLP